MIRFSFLSIGSPPFEELSLREASSFEDVSFEDVPLEAVSLEAVSLEAVSLEAVSLEAVSLEAVSLEDVSLEAVSLEDVPLEGVSLEDVSVRVLTFCWASQSFLESRSFLYFSLTSRAKKRTNSFVIIFRALYELLLNSFSLLLTSLNVFLLLGSSSTRPKIISL
ncbi:pentapeptide repeat-containing protein [Ignatzschineria sp. F8392]|uniref:pentapeptide repeat-containing protein n=1 Tax=Ignatzschineria sp. F8392 TaxID=1980117 RepID=UPI003511AC6E